MAHVQGTTYECTYCGTTNTNEKCRKCGKFKGEDSEEFAKYINSIEESDDKQREFLHGTYAS